MKNLIYFTVGFNPEYINLTYWCIYSLLYQGLSLENIDILIMCDQEYLQYVQAKLPSWIKIMITESNSTAVQCSMRKIEIFNYTDIHHYDKILYLDSDIIALKNIQIFFDKELDPNVLYVKAENVDHRSEFHSLESYKYTNEQLEFFEKNNIKSFSCGHFLFKNSNNMKYHFNNVITLIKNYTGNYFYEQSFMNYYFNLNNLTNIEFLNNYIGINIAKSINVLESIDIPDPYMVHICDTSIKTSDKLHHMKNWFHVSECNKIFYIYESRDVLPDVIQLPENSRIVEIGVLNGNYSQVLLKFNPYMLYLIDSYEGTEIVSGDKDGNNLVSYKPNELRKEILNKFTNPNVLFLHHRSTILETFPDNYLDLIYISGDQSFEEVEYNLRLSYKKIKHNGWICGHKYKNNSEKCNDTYKSVIQETVNKFCFEHLLKINLMFNDGFVSYAIRASKLI